MYKDTTLLLALLLWCAARVQGTPVRRQLTGYAPVAAACPATPLVRPANGVGSAEAAFIASRYTVASQSLAAWLATVANDATCNSASSARKRDWTDWGDWDKGDQSSSSNIPDPISASTQRSRTYLVDVCITLDKCTDNFQHQHQHDVDNLLNKSVQWFTVTCYNKLLNLYEFYQPFNINWRHNHGQHFIGDNH
ncbi:hypothetical protein LTR40_008767, partial [Exophiala xenobiotica]